MSKIVGLKEKNEQLKQRIKELETKNQCTLTKKEMIKEGLTPIVDVLIGKEIEKVNAETQTDKEEEEKKKQQITGIEEVMQSEYLNGFVYSLTETEDKRIASGSIDGSISISSYDVNKKNWNIDICKEKAHDDIV